MYSNILNYKSCGFQIKYFLLSDFIIISSNSFQMVPLIKQQQQQNYYNPNPPPLPHMDFAGTYYFTLRKGQGVIKQWKIFSRHCRHLCSLQLDISTVQKAGSSLLLFSKVWRVSAGDDVTLGLQPTCPVLSVLKINCTDFQKSLCRTMQKLQHYIKPKCEITLEYTCFSPPRKKNPLPKHVWRGCKTGPSQWLLPDFGMHCLEKPDWSPPSCPSIIRQRPSFPGRLLSHKRRSRECSS